MYPACDLACSIEARDGLTPDVDHLRILVDAESAHRKVYRGPLGDGIEGPFLHGDHDVRKLTAKIWVLTFFHIPVMRSDGFLKVVRWNAQFPGQFGNGIGFDEAALGDPLL